MNTKLIIMSLLTLVLSGCNTYNWDHRHDVAFATLINEEGRFHESAYPAAVLARFPVGSSVEEFTSYVKTAKGHCNEKPESRLLCEIPTKGDFCWAHIIGFDVGIESDLITGIEFNISGLGC